VSLSHAYSATGAAWRDGPERVYQRLSDVLVSASPIPLAGQRVADVGAGTGAASRAIERAGGRPIALDLARGMLRVDVAERPPAVVADVRHLPLAPGSCTAVVAAFSYNHVPDPGLALIDAARVVGPGGVVLASTYGSDDTHPVKAAADAAASEAGWAPEPWVEEIRSRTVPLLATVSAVQAVAQAVGLDVEVQRVEVPFPDLEPTDLVAWRLGMAQLAPFMARLRPSARRQVVRRALELLGPDPEPLVRRILVISITV
jgi:SAM-dependent methyltransferase